ncbi:MAG: head GIN domain-containing protein [Flavobacteriaceae bacterium]|nr:head GIN domain-containing protein [Flavobacteriaceae bacterium]
MKKTVKLFLFLVPFFVFSQQTVTANFGDFNIIKSYNGLKMELFKSHESKVEITAKKPQDIVIKNVNGTLKITLKLQETFKGEVYTIKVFYSNNIDIIDANEGSEISASHIINQPDLEIKTQEGAKINLLVDVKYLTVKSVSAGVIQLKGKVKNQQVETNTGGIYKGFNLVSEEAYVVAATAGIAEISATDLLDAKVTFGGEIYYKGNPEVLNTKKIVGGTIEPKKY